MKNIIDHELIKNIQVGIDIVSSPYEKIANALQCNEENILIAIKQMLDHNIIQRFGIILRHRELGYIHNAMVVWDIPDTLVDFIGNKISQYNFVALCYQRKRNSDWNYNLYCMIHGKNRSNVLEQIHILEKDLSLSHYQQKILFSTRCFKQTGAIYRG